MLERRAGEEDVWPYWLYMIAQREDAKHFFFALRDELGIGRRDNRRDVHGTGTTPSGCKFELVEQQQQVASAHRAGQQQHNSRVGSFSCGTRSSIQAG